MLKRLLSIAILLSLASQGWGQSVTLPETVTGLPGHFIIIKPLKVDGGAPKWRFDSALQEVDLSDLFEGVKAKGKIVTANAPGRYRYEAWNAKGDVASDIAVGWVVILGPQPPPVPPLPPVPPPPPIPPPPSPAPIPVVGFRVLVVFAQTGEAAVLTKQQYNEINGGEVAAYLNAKCAKDGAQPSWRIWHDKTPMNEAPKMWQDAMKRPRGNLPWIVISDGVSSAGSFEGPLPDGGILTLLRKYGG